MLRYESNNFFDQSNQDGHRGVCGNQTTETKGNISYSVAVEHLPSDLIIATQKINVVYAASTRELRPPPAGGGGGVGGNVTVYGVTQCLETISQKGCQDFLQQGFNDLQRCFSKTAASAVNDVLSKKIIIAAVVGGGIGGGILLLAVAIVLWWEKKGSLSWKQRMDIVLGTARGLAYLHEDFYMCIIHRDIKTDNILLDDDFQPKIADFGLARLLPESRTHLDTKLAGTMGYMSPEYALYSQLSEKADTYSYGVVVLEIISGQMSSELRQDEVAEYLLKKILKQTWKLYESGMHTELVDETISQDEYPKEEEKKVMEISLMCTQPSPSMRPTMSEVVMLLKREGSVQLYQPLAKPPLIDSNANFLPEMSGSTGSLTSNATCSISGVYGR
ncbi:unnamed protein product [Linum tenue]|uniref:Protein kinase domain-containing protein n=1 Tax=Linum tenue TaxID=586396 RepID=A0AAV0IY07_9ROSI|nr:unnamed protein product [Linum tenue]